MYFRTCSFLLVRISSADQYYCYGGGSLGKLISHVVYLSGASPLRLLIPSRKAQPMRKLF